MHAVNLKYRVGLLLSITFLTTSCDFYRVVTSGHHSPEIQTAQSVDRFLKQKRIDGYPVFCLTPEYRSGQPTDPIIPFSFSMYNRQGEFLDLTTDNNACKDREYYYLAMRYILEYGDSSFIKDSITATYYTTEDAQEMELFSGKKGMHQRPDLSKWSAHTVTYTSHFTQYKPYLRLLSGAQALWEPSTNYLVVWPFTMSGKSNLTCVLIRETIYDINKLNKEFGKQIQIVLINLDEMDWMH